MKHVLKNSTKVQTKTFRQSSKRKPYKQRILTLRFGTVSIVWKIINFNYFFMESLRSKVSTRKYIVKMELISRSSSSS